MAAKIVLKRHPPVWDSSFNGIRARDRYDTKHVPHVRSESLVDVELGVNQLAPTRIGSGTQHILRQSAIYERGWRRAGNKSRCRKGKAPGRRRIPDILYCWIVVDRHANQQWLAHPLNGGGIAQIKIVPVQLPRNAVICDLRKSAGMISDDAAVEQRNLVERRIVVRAEAWSGAARLIGAGVGKRALHHRSHREMAIMAIGPDITIEFEFAAVLRELRPKGAHVTLHAGKPGLTGKAWHCAGVRGNENCHAHHQQSDRSGDGARYGHRGHDARGVRQNCVQGLPPSLVGSRSVSRTTTEQTFDFFLPSDCYRREIYSRRRRNNDSEYASARCRCCNSVCAAARRNKRDALRP